MMGFLALAERCEQATADTKDGEREMFAINCEIEALLFDNHAGVMRSFTRSLDAAMTLVPEPECGVSVWRTPRDGGLCCATVHHGAVCEAATMPLALCAAALRARHALSVAQPQETETA
jgi:hypothetical protein